MKYIGRRIIAKNNRVNISIPVLQSMGVKAGEYVYVFIKDGSVYIAAELNNEPGVPVKLEMYERSSKSGRITIPVAIQKTIYLSALDEVDVYTDGKHIILKKINYENDINAIRTLARNSDALELAEKRELDALLVKLIVNMRKAMKEN